MEKTLKVIHEMLYETELPDTKSDKQYIEILGEIEKQTKKLHHMISSNPLHKEIKIELRELEMLYSNLNECYTFIDFKSSFFCGIYIGMQLEKNKKLKWDKIVNLMENDF